MLSKYRIKGILCSILSLSGLLSDEPDRVSQMMVLIKTVSKTHSPLFCLSVIYIQKSLQSWKQTFFCRYRKDFGSKLYLFPCKNYSFWGLLFSVCWFVKRHSFKRTRFIFSWTMNVASFSPFRKCVHILWITTIIWKLIHLKWTYTHVLL